jgi:predicted dehydrogenase
MRIGIVGGGNISETHARAARSIPGLTIVAFYGTNRERTARLAEPYGGAVYDDFERFLDHRPMDLVAIGSPSGLHAEQGIAAARRGLHVLVEKPLDITTTSADALIAAADAAGVKLGVFFQDRLRPAVAEMKARLDRGELGAPVMISGRVKWHRPPEYYAGSRWRGTWALDGGGALINQAIHTVDLLLWMFGPVARVYGSTATRLHVIEVEDTAAAVLEFATGAIGTIEAATSVFPGYARRVEMTGTAGTLVLEDDRLVRVDLRSPRAGADEAEVDEAEASYHVRATTPSATSPVVSDASAHRRVLEDFIRAVETNSSPACDGREGRRSVELIEAIYASARAHRPVALPAPRGGKPVLA